MWKTELRRDEEKWNKFKLHPSSNNKWTCSWVSVCAMCILHTLIHFPSCFEGITTVSRLLTVLLCSLHFARSNNFVYTRVHTFQSVSKSIVGGETYKILYSMCECAQQHFLDWMPFGCATNKLPSVFLFFCLCIWFWSLRIRTCGCGWARTSDVNVYEEEDMGLCRRLRCLLAAFGCLSVDAGSFDDGSKVLMVVAVAIHFAHSIQWENTFLNFRFSISSTTKNGSFGSIAQNYQFLPFSPPFSTSRFYDFISVLRNSKMNEN